MNASLSKKPLPYCLNLEHIFGLRGTFKLSIYICFQKHTEKDNNGTNFAIPIHSKDEEKS